MPKYFANSAAIRILCLLGCIWAPGVWAASSAWPEFVWSAQQSSLSESPVGLEQLPRRITLLIKQGKKPQAQAELAAALPALLSNPQQPSFTALQPFILAWDWTVPLHQAQRQAQANKQWDNAYWLACVLADYYVQNDDVTSAQTYLEQASFADNKSAAAEYASVLQGVLLQKQKKHRAAAERYAKIPPSSPVYLTAQLNLASVNIRQGWWSDAINHLQTARSKQDKQQTELANHLYMTLGFMQLKAGFYRDAMTSFKQVTQDSQYVRRAALGLGLSFLEQKKFPEAARIFEHLKSSGPIDMATVDSYFLVAVVAQNRLSAGHNADASGAHQDTIALYKSAINWYEAQLLQLTQVKSLLPAPGQPQALTRLKTAWEQLPLRTGRAQKLIDRQLEYWRWQELRSGVANANLQAELERELIQVLEQDLEDNHQVINAYLSNSRFGLANSYDKKN